MIKNDQKNENKIVMIISDENMEYMQGSNSFKILTELENQKKISKVTKITLTAFSDETTIKEIKSKGSDEILNKPLTLKNLKVVINNYLTKVK